MLGTVAFQEKLAEYSAAGVAVQVELVAEGTKVALPAGITPDPDPAPVVATATPASTPAATISAPRTPQSDMVRMGNQVGNAMGVVTSGMTGLLMAGTGLCLGAAGGALIAQGLSTGTLALAGGGLAGILSNLGVGGLLAAAVGAVSAATGGWSAGQNLGRLMGKVAGFPLGAMLGLAGLATHSSTQAANSRPPATVSPPPTPKRSSDLRRTLGSAAGGLGMLTGAAGGFIGGVLIANGGLLATTAILSGSAIAAGCVGAVILGVVSAMGAFDLSRMGE